MSWSGRFALYAAVCALALLLSFQQSQAQWFAGDLKDTTNRADYIIVTPAEYLSTVQPLATFRASHNALSVMTVLLDSIVSQFPRVTADSSIREFVTTALTRWLLPRPEFLLLAGNVNTIPSHRMPSEFAEYLGEDSIMADQWFVNQLNESQSYPAPAMAIGRFPAWTASELATMVQKTIAYEQAPALAWTARSIVVADSGDGMLFETSAVTLQQAVAPRWTDTITIHVRLGSPLHRSPAEFRSLWSQGSAIVDFWGHANGSKFSRAAYFTSRDVDSLAPGSPLAMCLLSGPQRFELPDSISIAVALLQAPDRGAVCVIAPSGFMYFYTNQSFEQNFLAHLSDKPLESVGSAWCAALERAQAQVDMRRTLLGDPALVIKSNPLASASEPGGRLPAEFALEQCYPNPFNPSTIIGYTVGGGGAGRGGEGRRGSVSVQLTVYDLLGRQVAMLVNEQKAPGSYQVTFDGAGLPTGMYFYTLQAGSFRQTRRMLLLK